MNPGYVIDVFDVGLGDLIGVELFANGQQLSMIIDGGTESKARELLPALRAYHSSNQTIVINTHPDRDHAGGLPLIIETLRPTHVFCNNPLNFTTRASISANARGLTQDSRDRLSSAIDRIQEIHTAASQANAKINTAFYPDNYHWNGWRIDFLNPNKELYELLWSTSEGINELYADKTVTDSDELRRLGQSVLDDGTDTSHMNNSSVITMITGYGQKLLFTGDAGMLALAYAAQNADITRPNFFDCPHHGSRRNLSTQLIRHIRPLKTSVSAPAENDALPCDEIIATLQHYGGSVFTTKHHSTMCHCWNVPLRGGYIGIQALPLLLTTRIVRS